MTIETKFSFGDIIEWTGFNRNFHGRVSAISVRTNEQRKTVIYGVSLPNGKWMQVNEDSARPHQQA